MQGLSKVSHLVVRHNMLAFIVDHTIPKKKAKLRKKHAAGKGGREKTGERDG
jgi:hypothetical protein